MPSKRQQKRGYLLPEAITGHQLLCVSLQIPNDPRYVAAFNGKIRELGQWWQWEKSYEPGDHRAVEAGNYWLNLIEETIEYGNCEPISGCTEFPPNSAIIEWLPNDPYRTPDYRPPEYLAPPWYVQPSFPPSLVGAAPGDVVTDFARIPFLPSFSPPEGFPRFRVSIKGSGAVELHLVNVLQGGLAIVQVDGDLFQTQFVDLNRDQVSIPPETAGLLIIELTITTPGDHFIDVTIIPKLNDEGIPLSFGGGLRKVVLCGFDDPCPESTMPSLRFTAECGLEYSNDAGAIWTPVPGWSEFAPICFEGPPGEDGENGEQGPPGADGEDCDCNIPPEEDEGGVVEPPNETDDAPCRIATKVSESLLDSEFVPLITDYVENVLGGILPLLNFIQSLPIFPTNGVSELIQLLTIVEVGDDAQVVTDAGNPQNREKIKCHLYCALGDSTSITADVLARWLAEIRADTSLPILLRERFPDFLEAYGLANIRIAALVAATTTDTVDCSACDCTICEEVAKQWQFGGELSYTLTAGYGAQAGPPGDGGYIESTTASPTGQFPGDYPASPDSPFITGGTNRNVIVRLNVQALVDKIEVQVRGRRADSPASAAMSVFLYCYDAQGEYLGRFGGTATTAPDVLTTYTINPNPVCVEYALIAIGYGSSGGSNAYIQLHDVKTFPTDTP